MQDKKYLIVPIILALFFIIFISYVSILRYYTFAELYDLALLDQIFWRLTHNLEMYSTLREIHIIGDHFRPIIFIILPLYYLWKSPILLIILQVIGAGLSVIPLFLISRRVLQSDRLASLICLGYITYPALLKISWYPFHPETIAILFIFCAFYTIIEKKYTSYFIFFFLALSCKEDISISLAVLSIYIFFKENKKIGFASFLISTGWFIMSTSYIIPYFAKGDLWFLDKYGPYGNTMPQILKTFLFHPKIVIKTSFFAYKIKINYIFALYCPTAFLGIFSPSTLILSFPQLIENLLGCSPSQWLIDSQYVSMIIPFVFISLIYGIKNLISFFHKKGINITKIIILIYTVAIILTQVFLNPFSREKLAITPHVKISHEMIKLIPPKNSISTNSYYLPHLSRREKILLYPNPFIPCFMIKQDKTLPEYILVDSTRMDNMIMANLAKKDVGKISNMAEFYLKLVKMALENPNYKLIKFKDGIILLKHKSK